MSSSSIETEYNKINANDEWFAIFQVKRLSFLKFFIKISINLFLQIRRIKLTVILEL